MKWLIVGLILGGIFVFYNNKKKFTTNFYSSLNLNQLQQELIKILELILHKHSIKSNYVNTELKNYDDLISLIHMYSTGLSNGDMEVILKLPFEFHPKGVFHELSTNNSWKHEFVRISKTFSMIYSEYRDKLN